MAAQIDMQKLLPESHSTMFKQWVRGCTKRFETRHTTLSLEVGKSYIYKVVADMA